MDNSELFEQTQNALMTFLTNELGVSSTFADTALQNSDDPSKRDRNAARAYEGYRTLLRFIDSKLLSEEQRAELMAYLGILERQLIILGKVQSNAGGSTP